MLLGRRSRSRALAAMATVAGGVLFAALARPASVSADLDNQLFTSSEHRIKITVPKGWRASDLPSYPGVILWMLRSQPEARIVVGAEPLRQELVCSWPAECRALSKPLAERYACALRLQLERQDILFGQIQAGPKENVAAGMPSVWFEFTDGKRYIRQAIAANERHVVSFALSAGSIADRGAHSRAFDQALRSLRELSEAEARAASDASPSAPPPDKTAKPESTPPAAPATAPSTSPSSATPTAATATSAPAEYTKISAPLFDPSKPCPGDPAPAAALPPSPSAASPAPSSPPAAPAPPPATSPAPPNPNKATH